ncbi:phosphoribosylglycinamide formyltransferase [Desnuesiella massiliensis]|uniref:phosphoribosylglycinamide formyltransferase n=1 Tax=Desnuesiella massiliensis TaxID=1650662 RepID=UPI0006E13801|nr:phosphoribosylglycinamide formyltransferase [Desnuesiella massiliensis]
MFKIAVLVSGGGSNLQAIIDSIEKGHLNCSIEAVISDNEKAQAVERASKKGIPTYVLDKNSYSENFGDKVLEIIDGRVDLIVLAGFFSILKGKILSKFNNKIINIHPSLIPSFCGKGMYGIKVHEAVIKAGVKITGCSVHFVNEEIDGGAIILQRPVEVKFKDTPEELQKRVLKEEHNLLPEAIKLISQGRANIINGRTEII